MILGFFTLIFVLLIVLMPLVLIVAFFSKASTNKKERGAWYKDK